MRRDSKATITVNAPPEGVWEVISDVTRVGQWSGECRKCEWVGASSEPIAGARFKGVNRRGWVRWSTQNQIDAAQKPTRFEWHTVSPAFYRDSTAWEISLSPTTNGTEVTLSFQVLELSRPLEWLIGRIVPAHRDRTCDLAEDLGRLKEVVEAASVYSR